MATQSVSYLSGEDPGTAKANAEYQDALEKMLAALDSRKNRMFDPQLLALAEGFLTPTKTGSFGESLGYAAGSLRQAQERQAEQDQKLAEARLGLAGKGLELERQRARERAFMQEIGGPAEAAAMPTPGGPAGAAPTGAPGAVPAGGQPAAGAAAPQGIRVSPGDPKFPTREQFLRRQMLDGKPLTDAMKAWEDLRKQNEEVRDVGTLNRATGMFYPNPNVSEVERKVGQSTYTMPAGVAFRLDAALLSGDREGYNKMVREFLAGPTGEPPKSKQESEIQQEEAKTYAAEMAKKAAEKEALLEQRNQAAQRAFGSATRIIDLAKQSPQALGILQNANVMSAIGTLLKDSIRVGNTSVGLGDIEGALRQVLPGVKKEDLDRVSLIASELAEIELAYTQLYMAKQGAITEGERAIVRQLGGSISNSADVLIKKSQLLAARSQHDMNVADKFYAMKDANPKLTYLQFERSPEYREMTKKYNDDLARQFGGQAAVPRPAGAGPAQTAPTRPPTGTPAAIPRPPGPTAPQGSGAATLFPGAAVRLDSMGLGR
jgi:hypothetical protein